MADATKQNDQKKDDQETQGTQGTRKPRKQQRTRKPTHFALGWVTETAPEQDADGKPIPGSERECVVIMPLPPGLDEAQKRSRDAIQRACKKAVYEQGLEEYGNRRLRVISYGEDFQYDFKKVEITTTKLLTPEEIAQMESSTEAGVSVDVKKDPADVVSPTKQSEPEDDEQDSEE